METKSKNQDNRYDFNREDIVLMVFKRKRLIMGVFFSLIILTVVGSLFLSNKYRVYADIFLDIEAEKTQVIPSTLTPLIPRMDLTTRVNIEKEFIQSPVVLRELGEKYPDLIEKLKQDQSNFRRAVHDWFSGLMKALEFDTPSEEKKLDKRIRFLQRKLDISQMPNSNIIRVSLLVPNPRFGTELISELLDVYNRHRNFAQRYPGASAFFEDQIEKSLDRITALEERLADYLQKERIVDYNEEILRVSNQLAKISDKISDKETELISLQSRLLEMRENTEKGGLFKMPSLEMTNHPFLSQIYTKRVELKLALISLAQKYRADDPQIVALERQVEQVDRELQTEVQRVMALTESSISRLKGEQEQLVLLESELRARSSKLPAKGSVIHEFTRQIENETKILGNLIQRRDQEMVSHDKDTRIDNIKLITPATFVRKKESPSRALFVIAAAFLGLVLGLGMAVVLHGLDSTIASEEQLERHTGLPALGSIQKFGNIQSQKG